MRIYVKGVPELEITTTLSDKELIVLLQAFQRGLITGKIRVNYYRGDRYLELAAIDVAKTLPLVIFEKPSLVPPPLEALRLSADFGRPSFTHRLKQSRCYCMNRHARR